MDQKILITYATKYGSTAEIAEKIGAVLRQAGLQTDVLPAKQVINLTAYKAVILGSAVYMGSWRKEAVQLLKTQEQALVERAVWLFSSGPAGEGDPVKLLNGWRFPTAQQPLADQIKPRDIAVFHGNLQVERLTFIEKWMIKNVKSPIGDFRDWDAITAWASSIADTLNKSV